MELVPAGPVHDRASGGLQMGATEIGREIAAVAKLQGRERQCLNIELKLDKAIQEAFKLLVEPLARRERRRLGGLGLGSRWLRHSRFPNLPLGRIVRQETLRGGGLDSCWLGWRWVLSPGVAAAGQSQPAQHHSESHEEKLAPRDRGRAWHRGDCIARSQRQHAARRRGLHPNRSYAATPRAATNSDHRPPLSRRARRGRTYVR